MKKDQILHIAELARIKVSDEEIEVFTKQITDILDYMNILNEVDTTNIEPTSQVTGLTNILREDKEEDFEAKDELLKCSELPIKNDQIQVPKILE